MFNFGTKIVILASTRRKKDAGPRKGSLGYAASCLASNVIEDLDLIASVNDVYFIRYGFEDSRRLEKKTIISLFPISAANDKAVKKKIEEIITLINSQNDSTILNNIRGCLNASVSTPIVIGSPAYGCITDLTKVDEMEFTAWFEGHLSSVELTGFISECLCTSHYKNCKIPNFNSKRLDTVRNMFLDKEFRRLKINEIFNYKLVMQDIIDFMQVLLLFSGRQYKSKIVSTIVDSMYNSGSVSRVELCRILSRYIYFPVVLDEVKNILKGSNHPQLQLVNEIENVKSNIITASYKFIK